MRKKLNLLSVILLFVLCSGCSASEIAKAIDQDLGTNTSIIAEELDAFGNEHFSQIDVEDVLKDGMEKLNDYIPLEESKTASKELAQNVQELVQAKLRHVTDGDTISVEFDDGTKNRVRLLTVCAEESVSSNPELNNRYGIAASDYLKEYLDGVETVWLQYDIEAKDKYDRDLCYVWLSPEVDVTNEEDIKQYMVNAILLQDGYVYTKVYEPNHLYAELFSTLEEEARLKKTGLWIDDNFKALADEKQEK